MVLSHSFGYVGYVQWPTCKKDSWKWNNVWTMRGLQTVMELQFCSFVMFLDKKQLIIKFNYLGIVAIFKSIFIFLLPFYLLRKMLLNDYETTCHTCTYLKVSYLFHANIKLQFCPPPHKMRKG